MAQAPQLESHGGSTYCAVASLQLLGVQDAVLDRDRLLRWCVNRQAKGFHGVIFVSFLVFGDLWLFLFAFRIDKAVSLASSCELRQAGLSLDFFG